MIDPVLLYHSVNDGTPLLSGVFVVPVPSFGADGFTDATQHWGAEVVGFGVVLTETTEETNSSGSGVELGDIMLLDDLPVTGWSRVDGGRLEDSGGDTVKEGLVDDVSNQNMRPGDATVKNTKLMCGRWSSTLAIHAYLSSGWTHKTYLTIRAAPRK